MRRVIGWAGVTILVLAPVPPAWVWAQEQAEPRSTPPAVEHDGVTAHAEADRAETLDADRVAIRREVALARARRVAPFDLTWGLEP